ncbi:hypothetical protein EG328_001132 [Venturia inaequalis]|uniref:Uncharacterized protein n=1 Tax=Venturia inaequalis TaxID=5025 RepID=A0A8H3V0K1_VENIN|nr:hypothetical protein EG328_001132 [Venturia inaequalis]
MSTFRLKRLHAQNNIMIKLCAEDNALEAEYTRKKSRGIPESHTDMQALRAKIAEATRKSYAAFATFKKIYDQDKPTFQGVQLNEVEKYHVAKVKFILEQIQMLPVSGGVAGEGDLRELHRRLREDLKGERQLLVKLLLRSAEACKVLNFGVSAVGLTCLTDAESEKGNGIHRDEGVDQKVGIGRLESAMKRDEGFDQMHGRSRSESVMKRDEATGQKLGRGRSESVRRRDEPIGNIENMMGELEEDLMVYLQSW